MSTRGTYKIIEKINGMRKIHYFYIQSDNDPQGAANYLQKVLDFKTKLDKFYNPESYNPKKTWSSIFEISIPSCEQAVDHEEDHGDTLYRYNINFEEIPTLRATRLLVGDMSSDTLPAVTWEEFYRGNLENFIEKFKNWPKDHCFFDEIKG